VHRAQPCDDLPAECGQDDVEILEVVAVQEEPYVPPAPAAPRGGPSGAAATAEPGPDRSAPAGGDPEGGSSQALAQLRSDYDCLRRRMDRERREFQILASAELVGRLLPCLDNFERALALGPGNCSVDRLREGLELVYRHLKQELRREGLRDIESLGQRFDPNLHEAVATGSSASEPLETVIEEFQRGYTFQDRVLRPALVRVSTVSEDSPAGGSSNQEPR
jgi:molecular chaperone GrpE